MALISSASKSEETSSFYLKHKTYALAWDSFNEEIRGTINGNYNAYYIDLKMEGKTDLGLMNIHAARKMANTYAGSLIPIDSAYHEYTIFRLDMAKKQAYSFVFKKKSLFSKVKGLFQKGRTVEVDDKYVIVSECFEKEINSLKNRFSGLPYNDFNLEKIVMTDKGQVTVSFQSFINNEDDLQAIMKWIRLFL